MSNQILSLKSDSTRLSNLFDNECSHGVVGTEWSLHQISPYIGKVKSSIAKFLVENFSREGDVVYDPFCGAGTIPLEAWSMGRNVVGNDLNKYAFVITNSKLFPNKSISEVIQEIDEVGEIVRNSASFVSVSDVPKWVADFFHVDTLKEIILWVEILKERRSWFLLSCMLGILHHQRPGFLSFPASHTVPYLRKNKFPSEEFPEMYEYRNVKERLLKKVYRVYKRMPSLNFSLSRTCLNEDAANVDLNFMADAIITSPPYMRQLNYARDNRLRLWFLDIDDHKSLDHLISPKEQDFIENISTCFENWNRILKKDGHCVLFLGDNFSRKYQKTLPEMIEDIISSELSNFKLVFKQESEIPNDRRVRRRLSGNKAETILAFKKVS